MLEHLRARIFERPINWKLELSNVQASESFFDRSSVWKIEFSNSGVCERSPYRTFEWMKNRILYHFQSSHPRAPAHLKSRVFECSRFWELAFSITRLLEKSNFRMLELPKDRIFEHSDEWKIEFPNARAFEGSHFRSPDHLKSIFWKLAFLERSSGWKIELSNTRDFERSHFRTFE